MDKIVKKWRPAQLT